MAVSAEFKKGLTKSKEAKAKLTEAKKVRPGAGFDAPDIPKANYILQVTCDADRNSRGNLEVVVNYKIMKGEYAGVKHKRKFELENADEDKQEFVTWAWEGLSKFIQVAKGISKDDLEDFESWSLEDICEVLDEISEEAPIIRAMLSPRTSGSGTRELNFYPNSLVEDIEAEELDIDPDDAGEEEDEEEVEEEAPKKRGTRGSAKKEEPKKPARTSRKKQEEEAEEEEEEETEEEEEEEEEETEEILKGNFVDYKPPRAKKAVECKVLSSNRAKETCTLQSVDDAAKKWSDVDWAECTLLEDDE